MKKIGALAVCIVTLWTGHIGATADMSKNMISEEVPWRFLTDGVMGGVSSGEASAMEENGDRFFRMTGNVSTENNGGFIQIRTNIEGVSETAKGVHLQVRGNDQAYFVHLRTRDARRPWHFFQARFDVSEGWQDIWLPFDSFEPSRGMENGTIMQDRLTSLGVVAYGRDHEAFLDVRYVGFY